MTKKYTHIRSPNPRLRRPRPALDAQVRLNSKHWQRRFLAVRILGSDLNPQIAGAQIARQYEIQLVEADESRTQPGEQDPARLSVHQHVEWIDRVCQRIGRSAVAIRQIDR